MIGAYATAQYQEMQVQTTPGKLVVMAYDGALRFLHLGLDGLRRGDRAAQSTNLIKAQNILLELSRTLDMGAGEIAENLESIYRYLIARLLVANAEDRPEPVEEAIRLMSELREAWDQAERSLRQEVPVLVGAAR